MVRPQLLEDRCKSALNQVPRESRLPFRWTVNPYRGCSHSCHYCFARAYHTYLDLGVGDDFATKIIVKTNIAETLRRELSAPRWTGETVAMGTATDPYQHCEGRYRLTRKVLEALIDFENPLSLLTKSTLVFRDLDLFTKLDREASASLAMSVCTLNESVRRAIEPGTPPGRKRLEILARFAEAGISTSVLIAPIMPGLTDDAEELDELMAACASAGVSSVSGIVLHIRPSIRPHFLPWLSRTYPRLERRYAELYGSRSYAPRSYRQQIAALLETLRQRHGIELSAGRAEPDASTTQAARRRPRPGAQLTLLDASVH